MVPPEQVCLCIFPPAALSASGLWVEGLPSSQPVSRAPRNADLRLLYHFRFSFSMAFGAALSGREGSIRLILSDEDRNLSKRQAEALLSLWEKESSCWYIVELAKLF